MKTRKLAALLAGSSVMAVASAAFAQTAAPAPTAASQTVGEVVVTGTRIVANGAKAPTPVTVVSPTQLQRSAPESIPAGLEKLPQFAPTAGANAQSTQAGTPSAGNYLNLRHLGSIENLLLLNGQRLPPTSFDGTVDANIIPQGLIQRVDIVTGGASAAYGSDAVSGVINFILDTKYNGFKGLVQSGVSTYGDDPQFRAEFTGGAPFAGGRGHVEFSLDHFQQPGIPSNAARPWGADRGPGWVETGNGTKNNPYTPTNGVVFGSATYGTLINAGQYNTKFSLRNYMFLPDGSIAPFNAGTPTGTTNFSVGGDGAVAYGATLTSKLETDQAFGRVDYDITDHIKAFAQLSFSESDTSYITVAAGTQLAAFQIFSDNAFLPDIVRQTMINQGVPSFVASRVESDQPPKRVTTTNDVYTFLTGLQGDVGFYNWSVNYSHGDSLLRTRHQGNFDNEKWYAALDAVRGPQGNIVCRVTLTNPGLLPGCVPWNPFGAGAPSQAAYNYILAASQFQVRNRQDDVSGQVSGPIFSLPAGKVNAALGAEFRHASLLEQSNTDPSRPISLTGLRTYVSPFNLQFNSTNVGPASGSENVEEVFAEVAVPVLRDLPFAEAFDLNAAARHTNYSISGGVNTWKFGGTWTPVDQFRFRGTISQDIRAPTLYELFAGTSATRGTFFDIHTNGNQNTITLSQGNPNLKPEIGHTQTVGVIWQPSYIPGLSASLDWFHIKIEGEITKLLSSDIVQQCEDSNGAASICQYVNRPLPYSDRTLNNFPTSITAVPFNQASMFMRGLDYELDYRFPLDRYFGDANGDMSFRVIGTYTPDYVTFSGPGAKPVQNAGLVTQIPKSKFNVSGEYHNGPVRLGAQIRYIGSTVRTTTPGVYYTDNDIPAIVYVDLNASYDFKVADHKFELYGTITNLTNKFVFIPNTGQPTEFYPSQQSLYDVVGRYFVAGLRFDF